MQTPWKGKFHKNNLLRQNWFERPESFNYNVRSNNAQAYFYTLFLPPALTEKLGGLEFLKAAFLFQYPKNAYRVIV